ATSQQSKSDDPPQGFEFRIVERLRNLAKQALPAALQTEIRHLEIVKEEAHHPVMDRVPEGNIELLKKHIERFVTDSRASDVEPVLMTHATRFGAVLSKSDHEMLTAWRSFYPMITEEGLLDMEKRGNDAIRQVAEKDHVLLIDAARRIPP